MAARRGRRAAGKKQKEDNAASSTQGSDFEEIYVEEGAIQTGSDVNKVDEAAGQ